MQFHRRGGGKLLYISFYRLRLRTDRPYCTILKAPIVLTHVDEDVRMPYAPCVNPPSRPQRCPVILPAFAAISGAPAFTLASTLSLRLMALEGASL
jgi:hypothetical protein